MIRHVVILILFLEAFSIVSSNCIWYGECNTDSSGKKKQNCPYNGTAKSVSEDNMKLLEKWCPNLLNGTDSVSCCDVNQMKSFDAQMSISKMFFGRCPSCFYNMVRFYCEFSCSANQSKFMNVKSVKKSQNGTGVEYIDEVEIFLSEDYRNSFFNSCKQISYPQSGQLIFDLACGSWGASLCTPKRWFEYLGNTTDNPYVPFNIHYLTTLKDSSAFEFVDLRAYECSESIDDTKATCSCMDCEQSCPILEYSTYLLESKSETFIFEYRIFVFFFVAVFIVVLCFKNYSMRKYFQIRWFISNTEKCQNVDNIEYVNEKKKTSYWQSFTEYFKHKHFEQRVENVFAWLGEKCALYPWMVLFMGFLLVCSMAYGISYVKIVTDPVELWSSKNSQCREERKYYNENFGPFYRISQVIVSSNKLKNFIYNTSSGSLEFGPVFREEFLLAFKQLQDIILKLGQPNEGLEQICFSPLTKSNEKPKSASKCLVQSVWGYFKNNKIRFEVKRKDRNGFTNNYLNHIIKCVQNIYNPLCLAEYGGPIDPALAFGGFLRENESLTKSTSYIKSNSLILTILINNHSNETNLTATLKWEKLFLNFMKNWTQHKPEFMEASYFSERSVEDEIDRESHTNVPVVMISYLAMFMYIALMLGKIRFTYKGLLESKIVLGLGGVLIVLSSVISSIGFNSFLGIQVSLITLEVIPFLVLAVGVDNIFILVQAFDKNPIVKHDELVEKYVGRIVGKIGPSILLAGLSEFGCFSLGALSDMPCVRAFALYAAFAILLNLILQLTCFVSLITLDYKCKMANRLDIFCCIKTTGKTNPSPSFLLENFKTFCTPSLLQKVLQPVTLIFFAMWFLLSVLVLPKISLGLDQEIGMPIDSYLLNYFQDLGKYLAIGPPVYFVVTEGLDLTNESIQNTLCGGQFCNVDSVVNQIYVASKHTEKTYIRKHPSSWIDDFFDWSTLQGCCYHNNDNKSFCSHDNVSKCSLCDVKFINNTNRPIPGHFERYLPFFLQDNPDDQCAKAGHAAYGQAVKYNIIENRTYIGPFSFMAYHSVLKTSKDYYTALKEARILADNITKTINSRINTTKEVKVFPYSVFYIYYEQYLTIWQDTLKNVGLSLLTVFVVCMIFTFGNLCASLIILSTVTMIVVDLMALLYFLDIPLNAVSLVNIVMAIGIAVEFCSHMVHYFLTSNKPTREGKAIDALNNIGSSVFSGITLTKFIGIAVLGFSTSNIFRIFYFQMYLGTVLIGAMHGLIYLPVLLNYWGPLNSTRPPQVRNKNTLVLLNQEQDLRMG